MTGSWSRSSGSLRLCSTPSSFRASKKMSGQWVSLHISMSSLKTPEQLSLLTWKELLNFGIVRNTQKSTWSEKTSNEWLQAFHKRLREIPWKLSILTHSGRSVREKATHSLDQICMIFLCFKCRCLLNNLSAQFCECCLGTILFQESSCRRSLLGNAPREVRMGNRWQWLC